MMNTIRVTFILILLILASGCVLDPVEEPRRPDPISEPTLVPTQPAIAKPRYVVEVGTVTESLEFAGRVAPVAETEIRFEVAGIVGDVFVEVGDLVMAGDVIATLDQALLAEELAQAEADLATAQSELTAAQNLIINERRLLEIAVERAQIQLAYAQSIAGDSASPEQELEIQLLELDVEEAQLTLDLFGSVELPLNDEIETLQAQIALIETQMATAELVAPQSGELLAFTAEIGDQVRGGQIVGLIGDTTDLEIKADVNDRLLSQLDEGMSVTIFNNRLDMPETAVIRQLPAPYGSGDLDDSSVRIALANIDSLPLGVRMPVNIEIILQAQTDVPWLPPAAIREFSGRRFVLIEDEDGNQRRIDLRLGLETNEKIEIVDGLVGGETVIGP